MRANHGDGVSWLPFLSNRECDNGRSITSDVVFTARYQGRRPRIAFLVNKGQARPNVLVDLE